jgi:hypothetical protein
MRGAVLALNSSFKQVQSTPLDKLFHVLVFLQAVH